MKMRMPNGISRRASDCFVGADEEFDTYFQPIKQLPSVKPPTHISCPVPKFRISHFDSSDDYSEVFMNNEDTILFGDHISEVETPPALPPKNLEVRPPCPPYSSLFLRKEIPK
jgi:hypothetical protein